MTRVARPWSLDVPGRPSQTGAMGFYREQILPRLTGVALRGTEAARQRARATAGLSGEVLEVGFGSGLTMPYYPPAVTRLRAVDPSAVARKLAADRVAASAVPVDYAGVDAQTLPLEDASIDHVVGILTLCTIPSAERALAEIGWHQDGEWRTLTYAGPRDRVRDTALGLSHQVHGCQHVRKHVSERCLGSGHANGMSQDIGMG